MIATASFKTLSPKIIANKFLSVFIYLKRLNTATGSVAEISAPKAIHISRGIAFT